MHQFTLNSKDIQSCIELAADGVNLHIYDQSKIDAIHKVMYAVAEAAQNNQTLTKNLALNQPLECIISLQKTR